MLSLQEVAALAGPEGGGPGGQPAGVQTPHTHLPQHISVPHGSAWLVSNALGFIFEKIKQNSHTFPLLNESFQKPLKTGESKIILMPGLAHQRSPQ